jgi:hypothetical protein
LGTALTICRILILGGQQKPIAVETSPLHLLTRLGLLIAQADNQTASLPVFAGGSLKITTHEKAFWQGQIGLFGITTVT